MKRAKIYARYSSERQTEQSIEGQLRVCKEFAEKNDIVIVDTYIDRAKTGTNDNRPAFQKMLRDSDKEKTWDILLVYAIDRFGRNSIEIAVNKQRLAKNGKLLISATQRTSTNIDGTKNLDGILLENVMIGLAEYYSAELSQKIRRGQNESRQKHQFTGGGYLYGYDIIDKKYVINEQEAEVVRKVYSDYINGKTAKDIVAELNGRGLKTKRGGPFVNNSIYKMLRNERYIGIVRYGEEVFTDTVPSIIDNETWKKVQSIIEKNKKAPSKRKSYGKFLLSGKLYCGDCGSLMTGESGRSKTGSIYHYYKCFGKKKLNGCTFPTVPKKDIESKVLEVCGSVLQSGFIPTIVDIAYKQQLKDIEADSIIISLKTQLAEKEKALSNLLKAIEDGIYTTSTKGRLQQLEKDIEEITSNIDAETIKRQNVASKEDYLDFLNQFIARQINNEDFKEELVRLLIRRIVVFRDKLRITFNLSPNGKSNDEEVTFELSDAQEEYANSGSSDLVSLTPPNENNPNSLQYFIRKGYWGVWVSFQAKRH